MTCEIMNHHTNLVNGRGIMLRTSSTKQSRINNKNTYEQNFITHDNGVRNTNNDGVQHHHNIITFENTPHKTPEDTLRTLNLVSCTHSFCVHLVTKAQCLFISNLSRLVTDIAMLENSSYILLFLINIIMLIH